jgi:alpha-1,6-mannosyltransferase
LKICDITQSFTPTGGGIRTYLLEKRKFVSRRPGDEHVLIALGARGGVRRTGNLVEYTLPAPGLPGCAPYRWTLRLDRIRDILRRERPDVIELGCPYLLPYAALWHRRERPVALVGFYHTDFPAAYADLLARGWLGRHGAGTLRSTAYSYVRFLYRKFDLTLTASPAIAERLRGLGLSRVRHLALGVDLDAFHPSRRSGDLRERLGLPADGLLLAYAGRIDAEKRVDVVLRAFERASARTALSLVIIGDGPGRPELTARFGGHPRIRFLPYQGDRVSLAEILASADIYLTAGPSETFGLSVIEAQACGLPVVGVRAGALIERVSESTGLLGPPGSAAAMAENILRIATNGYVQMGRNARALVEKSFSWGRTFRTLFAWYDELARS